MKRIGIQAVTLESGTLREAYEKENRNLWRDVQQCHHPVVILSPERLTHPEFSTILRDEAFRKNIVALLLDEAHLIIPWGLDFRKSFGNIPQLLARIPPKVPCIAVTATSCPGRSENKLLGLLGFRSGTYKETRQSNERPNVCKAYLKLNHGLEGPDYPDIVWIVTLKKKTIIYCCRMRTCARVAEYLRSFLPPGPDRLHQIRQYHSLIPQSENLDTLTSFENDPDVFCIVATVKFGMGLDARRVSFVVILGLPTTVETAKQEEGRVARDESLEGMAITYVEKSIVSVVQKEIAKGLEKESVKGAASDALLEVEDDNGDGEMDVEVEEIQGPVRKKKKQRKIDPELKMMVRCHVLGSCLVAEDNRIFGNQGPSTRLNCLLAQRRLPCSSCFSSLPAFIDLRKRLKMPLSPTCIVKKAATTTSSRTRHNQSAGQKKHKPLTKSMKDRAESHLWSFARQRWLLKNGPKFRVLPSTALFSDGSIVTLLNEFHRIRDRRGLSEVLVDWKYLEDDGDQLFELVQELNVGFDVEQQEILLKAAEKRKATLAKKKAAKKLGNCCSSSIISQFIYAINSLDDTALLPTENTLLDEEDTMHDSDVYVLVSELCIHLSDSLIHSPMALPIGEQETVGIKNTPPNTPRKKARKRQMATDTPRKKARLEDELL